MAAKLRLLIIYLIGLFWTFVILLNSLKLIFKRKTKFFTKRNRVVAPECLSKEEYGVHTFTQVDTDSGQSGSNVKLHYVVSGPEHGKLMLFVHGFPEFWYSWRHQITEFNKKYRVAAMDMRGYGGSSKPKAIDQYTTEKLCNDIKRLIESFGGMPIILVGHDWGGAVVWSFVAQYPHLVEKAIVMNCPHPGAMGKYMQSSWKQFLMSWYMFAFQIPYFPEWLLSTDDLQPLENMFNSKESGTQLTKFTDEEIEAYKYTYNKRSDWTGPINFYRAMMQGLSNATTKEINKKVISNPVLLCWGTHDKALSNEMAEMSRPYAPNLQVKYVNGASHWVQQDDPTTVNRLMWDFLKQN